MTENAAQTTGDRALATAFRQAMRQLVATVTIVTAGDAATRAGMVATAVMSVSAEPPSLVIGVNREAGVWEAIHRSGYFGVNLLGIQHTDLVPAFSGGLQGEERFSAGSWERHHLHIPYLADALVTLFCRVDGVLDYGTHTLFVGVVSDIQLDEGAADPLLWRDGGFANAVPMDTLLT